MDKTIISRANITLSTNYSNVRTHFLLVLQSFICHIVEKRQWQHIWPPPSCFHRRTILLCLQETLCLIKLAGREPRLFALLLSSAALNTLSPSHTWRAHRRRGQQLRETHKDRLSHVSPHQCSMQSVVCRRWKLWHLNAVKYTKKTYLFSAYLHINLYIFLKVLFVEIKGWGQELLGCIMYAEPHTFCPHAQFMEHKIKNTL